MTFIRHPTIEEVRHLRDTRGCGIFEARRILTENAVSDAILKLKVDEGLDSNLCEVLDAMMDLIARGRY